ncbi:MAG TPA: tetratricopeptide repeat-containing protein [Pyrinomonadaceae bacterium]|nr:tetratricopeptide repeat-containing protein [Pyrinomonadaceae bacterium]
MPEERKTCFVVMGFGEKVDFQTGRKLNLDASYHNMIKPTVEEAGLRCIRADEIVHSGVIDVPMYEQLLKADVVIADLSTYNPNAFYELGVRHALRPFSTIVIAEDKLNYPFDVNHIVIRRYKHLGNDIGVGDARKFSAEMKEALRVILEKQNNDSPVYEFLNGLTPPEMAQLAADVAAQAAQTRQPSAPAPEADGVTLRVLLREADEARRAGEFLVAKRLLTKAREVMKPKGPDDPRQEDPYIIQQLALVTYKSKQPTPKQALEEARDLLETLNPATSNDTETLGLWGAVHKRLWEQTKDAPGDEAARHLDQAVRGYERGFYLRNDYYNGINLAYVLNIRAKRAASPEEAVADFVQARRVCREVVGICDEWLKESETPAEDCGEEEMVKYNESKYWVLATLAEAYVRLGDEERAQDCLRRAYELAPAEWMKNSTEEQLSNLRQLLADPPLKYIKADAV